MRDNGSPIFPKRCRAAAVNVIARRPAFLDFFSLFIATMDVGKYFIEVKELPQTTEGLVQLLFLGGTYGYILCYASNLISDGSELLLLIPSMAGIIGSVVLPMLGAVPDGCMVLFSGLGPEAQGNFKTRFIIHALF